MAKIELTQEQVDTLNGRYQNAMQAFIEAAKLKDKPDSPEKKQQLDSLMAAASAELSQNYEDFRTIANERGGGLTNDERMQFMGMLKSFDAMKREGTFPESMQGLYDTYTEIVKMRGTRDDADIITGPGGTKPFVPVMKPEQMEELAKLGINPPAAGTGTQVGGIAIPAPGAPGAPPAGPAKPVTTTPEADENKDMMALLVQLIQSLLNPASSKEPEKTAPAPGSPTAAATDLASIMVGGAVSASAKEEPGFWASIGNDVAAKMGTPAPSSPTSTPSAASAGAATPTTAGAVASDIVAGAVSAAEPKIPTGPNISPVLAAGIQIAADKAQQKIIADGFAKLGVAADKAVETQRTEIKDRAGDIARNEVALEMMLGKSPENALREVGDRTQKIIEANDAKDIGTLKENAGKLNEEAKATRDQLVKVEMARQGLKDALKEQNPGKEINELLEKNLERLRMDMAAADGLPEEKRRAAVADFLTERMNQAANRIREEIVRNDTQQFASRVVGGAAVVTTEAAKREALLAEETAKRNAMITEAVERNAWALQAAGTLPALSADQLRGFKEKQLRDTGNAATQAEIDAGTKSEYVAAKITELQAIKDPEKLAAAVDGLNRQTGEAAALVKAASEKAALLTDALARNADALEKAGALPELTTEQNLENKGRQQGTQDPLSAKDFYIRNKLEELKGVKDPVKLAAAVDGMEKQTEQVTALAKEKAEATARLATAAVMPALAGASGMQVNSIAVAGVAANLSKDAMKDMASIAKDLRAAMGQVGDPNKAIANKITDSSVSAVVGGAQEVSTTSKFR